MQKWDDPPCSHDHGGCKVQPCEIHHHRVHHLHDQPWPNVAEVHYCEGKKAQWVPWRKDPQKESKRWKWSGWFSLLNIIFKSDQILQKIFRQRVPPHRGHWNPCNDISLSSPALGPSLQKDHWASSLQNDKMMLTTCSTPKKPSSYFRSTRG